MSTKEYRVDALKKLGFDDKFAAFLEQQLQSVEVKIYKVLYPDLRARKFIPLKSDVSPGAETFAYWVFDVFGEAIWISNYANELPNQAVRGEKVVGKIEGMGAAYSYSSQDLRASAMAGLPLDSDLQAGAMKSLERKVDRTAALGDLSKGFYGFGNHPNPDVLAATASWALAGTTADVILADLQRVALHVREITKEIFSPDTILLPTAAYDRIATSLLNSTGSTSDTILTVFLRTNPWVKSVESWPLLGAASAAGGGRLICYQKTTEVVALVIPMEPLQHEPQKMGFNYQVPIEMRFGGVIVRQPKAFCYMDGVS